MQKFPMLSMGPLPDGAELNRLAESPVDYLVNLSGVSLKELYGADQLASFVLQEFVFPDVFSQVDALGAKLRAFEANYEEDGAAAIRSVGEGVRRGYRVHCFCHQGVSRSPLVVAGALVFQFALTPQEAVAIVLGRTGAPNSPLPPITC